MRMLSLCLVGGLAVVGAEVFSAWWMNSSPPPNLPVLEWSPPSGKGWTVLPEAYDEVDEVLRSTSGWIGEVESGGRPVRISFIRWDDTSTRNSLEAFYHPPETCMGAIGMKLERRFEPRTLEIAGRSILFDVTFYRPEQGGVGVYLYKGIVVSGQEREWAQGDVGGFSMRDWRRMRLATAWQRFRPPHSRVLMAGMSGVPTESLAWREFRSLVEPHLRWTTSSGDAEEGNLEVSAR